VIDTLGFQVMDEMEDDLVAAYNGLGTADGDEYYRGDDCHG